jgi:hypothetical protein
MQISQTNDKGTGMRAVLNLKSNNAIKNVFSWKKDNDFTAGRTPRPVVPRFLREPIMM